MPHLSDIVTLINTELRNTKLSDKRFDKGQFLGIARLLPRIEEEQTVTVPAIVANNGTCTDVIINDVYPFIIYHRVLDLSYSLGDAYGDNQLKTETANMVAIVYGDRNILKIEPEQLAMAVEAGFLNGLSDTDKTFYNLQKCNIEIGSLNLNSQQVYSQEYSGDVEYILKPNSILFSIAYNIVAEYDKTCIDIC